jgi:hypothetical protein
MGTRMFGSFLILVCLAGCSDTHAIDACRELARSRDNSGKLLLRGEALTNATRVVLENASKSKSPRLRESVNTMAHAAQTQSVEEWRRGLADMKAACAEFK